VKIEAAVAALPAVGAYDGVAGALAVAVPEQKLTEGAILSAGQTFGRVPALVPGTVAVKELALVTGHAALRAGHGVGGGTARARALHERPCAALPLARHARRRVHVPRPVAPRRRQRYVIVIERYVIVHHHVLYDCGASELTDAA